jgi:hypothetical protein
MSERAPYSRVYWSVMHDDKFDGVREDPRLIGSWLLLLIVADMAYPSPAYVLPTVSRSALKRLEEAGLVDLLDGHRYRIHGLDAERERRRTLATTRGPSGDRPVPVRDPLGDQAKQSKAETSKAEAPREDTVADPAEAYWSLTGRFPTEKPLSWIDDLTRKYGAEATIRALVKAHTTDRDASTLLGRSQDLLRSEARQLDRQERDEEQARLREKRAQPRTVEPWRKELADLIEKQYGENAA